MYRENEVTCTTGWQEIVDKLNFFTTEAHKNVAAVARHEQNIAGLLEELNVASWVCAIYVLVLHLNNHMPTRRIAEDWINPRTGKPYSHMHVKRVLQAVTQA